MQHSRERSAMLGTAPMARLVPRLSIPIMVSMLVQAMYNVVDSIFVARFDPNGLTAVSLAYPFQMLMVALSVGMGTGINSLLSRHLGEKRAQDARTASWNGLLIEGAGSLLFILTGLFLARPLMEVVVSDQLRNAGAILDMGISYLSIVTTWSLGLFLSVYVERLLQATGNTLLSMVTQLVGALTNIILDPILIFGLLGSPRLGVPGAAIATVIGQWCSALTGFLLNQFRNPELRLNPADFRLSRAALAGIFAVGLPSTVMQAISSAMNLGMNGILSGFEQSNAALNVMSVYFKLQSFVFMPVFGLSNGIMAILAYNYGARNRRRIQHCLRVALIWAGSILLAGTLIFLIFPAQLMSIFESEAEAELTAQMTSIGVAAMRVICLGFLPATVGIVLSTLFQAVGRGTYSMLISLARQMFILLPAAWLIARLTGSVYAVWWCFPLAESVAFCMSLFFYRKCSREMLSRL